MLETSGYLQVTNIIIDVISALCTSLYFEVVSGQGQCPGVVIAVSRKKEEEEEKFINHNNAIYTS